ncbi:MAG: hypothetical protein ACJ8CR_07705 [Roseiflexaceae bacterium]
MWYITFHGGDDDAESQPAAHARTASHKQATKKSGVNKVYAYDDTGQLITKDVLPKHIPGVTLRELRGIAFGPDGDLYVVNAYWKYSQILHFKGAVNPDGSHDFVGIFAAPPSAEPSTFSVDAISHPFAFTYDPDGNWYISSQDTNVVTRLPPNPATPLTVAPYLAQTYPQAQLLAGTFITSSNGALAPQVATNVPPLQGLEVLLATSAGASSSSAAKVAKSVRDVVFHQGVLYVADEPASAVKLYDGTSGALIGQIADARLLAQPVHLLLAGDTLLIGSTGTADLAPAVLSYDPATKTLAGFITGIASPAGIAQGADGCFYVASRKDKAIMKYVPQSQTLSPFIQSLPDEPEFLLYVPNPA